MATTTVIPHAIVLEVLNRDNYKHWRFLVRTYLLGKDLWDVIKAKPPKPEDGEVTFKAWTKKNAEALHAIVISCGTDVFSIISDTKTAKSAWEALEKEFKPATPVVQGPGPSSVGTTVNPGQVRDARELMPNRNTEIAQASVEVHENNATVSEPDLEHCKLFFDLVTKGDWHNAKECLTKLSDPQVALRAVDPRDESGDRALHVAAKMGRADIVNELVSLMTNPKDLEVKNANGYTALGSAVNTGSGGATLTEMVKYMVDKNKEILTIGIPPKNSIPVVEACGWNRWELASYLYSVTPAEALMLGDGHNGAQLLIYCFRHMKGLDIACDLIKKFPILAVTTNCDGQSPMLLLASTRSAFYSGMRLTFWQKWIYPSIQIQPTIPDIFIYVPEQEDHQDKRRDLIHSVMSLFRRFLKEFLKFLGIYQMYENKLIHVRIHEFLLSMHEVTKRNNLTTKQRNIVSASIFKAIERGHVEFVTNMCKANPRLLKIRDKEQKNIFHFAIQCRQEKIYSLIYGINEEKRRNLGVTLSKSNNSMLHMTGNLSPLPRFNYIQGAALQMQRELQWFKEVENIVPPEVRESLNTADLTARELFTQNHKELMNAAESSMKGTATSCTVVGALIVTMMFAAAFTVPGGNDSHTGFPMFMDKKLFKVFIVSDAVSLVSSITSVITFLGILTSGYAEDDFLKSLPTKMMIGLFTLFFSIAAMMITFSSALVIMLDARNSWIVIPSILLASVPVTSFVVMQVFLLFNTFMLTYGPGIFDKEIKPWY